MGKSQNKNKTLSTEQQDELLKTLETRFKRHMDRHKNIEWANVRTRLEANPEKTWSLHEMERTGGEPDVVGQDEKTGGFIFYDCVAQSPEGRRALCYDREALESRKVNKPEGDALSMAASMGIDLLTEEQYFYLQELGEFDTTTSSWLKTPSSVRDLGGAIYGDRRFDRVFVYHNGAESYYSSRGFRGSLRV